MANKEIVPTNVMVHKLEAGLSELNSETFVLARTDAYESEGLRGVINRGEAYLKAGAHGFYVEGVDKVADLEAVGREFEGVPLALSILENGGKTPWIGRVELHQMGYSMVLYPTTLLFDITYSIEETLKDMRAGLDLQCGVSLQHFEEVVQLRRWRALE